MEERRRTAVSQEILVKIGKSLVHWTNYLASVNRINVLTEYAIRYATSEYLEVEREKCKIVRSEPSSLGYSYTLKDYDYEHSYPCYISKEKKADLFISLDYSDEASAQVISSYIEFKYIKKNINRIAEFSSDIRRLAVLNKNCPSASSFFIVFGLRSCIVSTPKNTADAMNRENRKIENYYGKLLSFQSYEKHEISLESLVYNGEPKTWSLDEGYNDLSDHDRVYSELFFCNSIEDKKIKNDVLIYIWRISVDSNPDSSQL